MKSVESFSKNIEIGILTQVVLMLRFNERINQMSILGKAGPIEEAK